jgi:glycerol transport system permease protein
MSIVYNLIILAACWLFYTVMTNVDAQRDPVEKGA